MNKMNEIKKNDIKYNNEKKKKKIKKKKKKKKKIIINVFNMFN